MSETTQERFDIENVDYDKDGIPIIPRIGFWVPKAYRAQFLQDMIDEVRSTPGEQLMAIFVKYMRSRRPDAQAQPLEGERRRIPVYVEKAVSLKNDQGKAQNSEK